MALVLVIAIGSNQGEGGPGADQAVGRTESQASFSAAPSISVSPSPKTKTERVSSFVGTSQKSATRSLENRGFLVVVEEEFSSKAPSTVIQQVPRGGSLEVGSTVVLTIARPLPEIPDVVGMRLAAARRALRNAGFSVVVEQETSSAPEGIVLSETPVAGTSAKPGRKVTIVVAKAEPSSADGDANCTPGYSPCLPPASDYDCAGGSGDGPEYTGPVRVTGSDPYGLDSDGDGWACES